MEKRLILAIALSLLIALSWSAITSKLYHVENKGVTTPSTPQITAAPARLAAPQTTASTLTYFDLSLPQQEIVFSESEAGIKQIKFPEYQNYVFEVNQAFSLRDELKFTKTAVSGSTVQFVYSDQEKRISKDFIVNPNYTIELHLRIKNMSNLELRFDSPLVLGTLSFAGKQNQMYQEVTAATPEKILRLNGRKEAIIPQIKFLGLRDRYFCAIIEPPAGQYSAFVHKVTNNTFQVGLQPVNLIVLPGQEIEQFFHIYLGPQELKTIHTIKPDWTAVIHYGTFDIISQLLLQVLGFIHNLVRNWGVAIIILSILIYLILYPLTLKQMRSMKEMQVLQPLVEGIRQKYKDNPQRLNREIMELYREHKVNPFGGCLPLLLQLPIFFALYQAIMRSIALKGAQFLWIKDLSEPDRLFVLPTGFPLSEINILPILMAIGMFIQQKVSLKAASGPSAEQQKIMSILMPLLFGVIFYRMPAALVLYWFVNSSLTLIYQMKVGYAK